MTEIIQKSLRESKTARWIALLLVSLSLLTGYFFADVMSPLKTMLVENPQLGWDSEGFGIYAGAYSWFNVFFLMLIFGGIILDRKGIRFTGTTFIVVMIIGAAFNYYALSESFLNHGIAYDFLGSFLPQYSPSVKMASLGYALFGVGVEILGITGSRMVVKWFKGKEMATAMALQVALSRLGMFWVMYQAPRMAGTEGLVSRPVAFGVVLLAVGLATFLVYNVMDVKLDKEEFIDLSAEAEEFKITDAAKLFANKAFIYISLLCVLFYAAVFPFMKFASDLMVNKFGIPAETAGDIPGLLPIGSMILTPIFGLFLDYKGKSASIMILGAFLLIFVHLGFAFGPASSNVAIALMILLGIAFSLVPAAMWPAVPKIIEEKYLGSAYAMIFYIQNIGLMLYPMLIGWSLEKFNPGVTESIKQGIHATYDYTIPMEILALTGVFSLLFAILLRRTDRTSGFGLELPNKK
jgi:MFS family permease